MIDENDGAPSAVLEAPATQPGMDGWHDDMPTADKNSCNPWKSPEGRLVLVAGILLPLGLTLAFCGVCADRVAHIFMRQWLSSTVELLLALMIPVGNFFVWRAICNGDKRYAIRRGIINGISIGAALTSFAVCSVALFLGRAHLVDATLGSAIFGIAVIFAAAFAAGLYVAWRLRLAREVRSARTRTILYSLLGVLLAMGALVCAETRSFYLRWTEQKVVAAPQKERANALAQLRSLQPEFDLRLECSDTRAAGISGLFMPLKSFTLQQLYFAAAGKPFNDNKGEDLSGFSDDYLKRHVVGTPVDGLSLVRSEISASVHPDSLSSTIDWTFVLKNAGNDPAEARAEIGIPPGAVINGLTMWTDGKPTVARFAASANAPGNFNWVNIKATDPALVRDLGRGRTLIHCYPVAGQDELKVRISMAAPLKLQDESESTLALPRLIDANFSVEDDNALRLRSPMAMELKQTASMNAPDGARLLVASLQESDLKGAGLTVKVHRISSLNPVTVRDQFSGALLRESIQKTPATAPSEVVVVLDGSESMVKHLDDIKTVLAAIPDSIKSYLILAKDDHKIGEPVAMKQALASLSAKDFVGGQDNLQAICKAAESAGETAHGAVLWLHGPQSGLNKEIYILPDGSAASFYECALDGGPADSAEFFKNHPEIGPFASVPCSETSIKEDLSAFFRHMHPGSFEYRVNIAEIVDANDHIEANPRLQRELASLFAAQETKRLLSRADGNHACATAVRYGIVSTVSSAVIIADQSSTASLPAAERDKRDTTSPGGGDEFASGGTSGSFSQDPTRSTQSAAMSQTEPRMAVPPLQGATNGTIGPQGQDSTYVTGLNTAAAVRVNNLANLEALLNVIANGIEVIGLPWGAMLVFQGVARLSLKEQGQKAKWSLVMCGLLIMFFALGTPGTINWLVASARDANLFN